MIVMKNFLLIILFILLYSCNQTAKPVKHENDISNNIVSNKELDCSLTEIVMEDCHVKEKLPSDREILKLLQGVWALNTDDNALFYIKEKTLIYTEEQTKPIKIDINDGYLVINGDVSVKCEILRINNDTLYFIDEFSDDTTKLYKRRTPSD